MALQNLERSSLDIQPVSPDDGDDGKSTQKVHPQSWKPKNSYPEITRIAIEIGQRDKTTSKRSISDSTLDPTSPAFDFRKWAENILRAASDANWKFRQTSVLLKEVEVLGAECTEEKQENVASVLLWPFQIYRRWRRSTPRRILRRVDGILRPGDMLLVLGKPGSGCSSLLKTIAGDLEWLFLGENSVLRYNGIPRKEMSRSFRGETVYNAESDVHFPHLTVKQTLEFASALRMPRNHVVGLSREEHIRQITAVAMAMCGLTDAQGGKVGSDYVRGVSGGERKRVSIAEMILARASVGCWDNSTRGLDSATALKFVTHLKTTADLLQVSHVAALYQASEAIYKQFNKVMVLYEGREIYFGPTAKAKAHFEEMGWLCEPRQATPDFLIGVTNNTERKTRLGFEDSVPRSPDEFEQVWRSSREYKILQEEMTKLEEEESELSVEQAFRAIRRAAQAKFMLSLSPYTINLWGQFQACLKRAYQRSWNDEVPILTTLFGQVIMALVVRSLFYRVSDGTDGLYSTGSVLFFVVLLNTVVSVTEIGTLYEQRPIIQKHTSYAFCHPSIESLAVLVLDIPIKLVIGTCFNITLYFLAGLRVEASAFFIFYLDTILVRFTLSSMFRTIGSITKRYNQALAIAGVLLLATLNYTGFTLPRSHMHPWFEWIIWINPLAYAFEVLMVNEVNGVEYACAGLVPDYPNMTNIGFVCPVPGAIVGKTTVSGNAYVEKNFQYSYSHLWRDVGILFGFWVFFTATYLAASELNLSISGKPGAIRSVGKKLYRPSHHRDEADSHADEESLEQGRASGDGSVPRMVSENTLFSWHDVTYDVRVANGTRRLLDNISAWVKSGQLTALMGVSGAGKTTLLDFLARRLGSGMRSGNVTLSGVDISPAAIDTLGYVPQQDVLFPTATVRESLRLSALLRQPSSTTKAEKYHHVEEIIEILGMQDFSNVIIGSIESGLNMEQRKLASIGVELAAKPQCLLFLDEPTSGLDSQSSLAIVALLRRLANSGMAILATIHQPSAVLLQKFDRLIFLAKGGKPVYFGDIGPSSQSVVDYFIGYGARKCDVSENPAEYLTEILAPRADDPDDLHWARIWRSSEKRKLQNIERDRISANMSSHTFVFPNDDHSGHFEAPIYAQLLHTSIRVFRHHWRMPSYVLGKLSLCLVSSLFIGFSFYQSPNSMQGVQDVIFSIFMIAAILSSLLQQIMPQFIVNRSLYEIREGPSRTYSWVALVLSNMIVEVPYQIVLGIMVYASYYYPVFGIQLPERQGIILLYCVQYFLFATTLASMLSAATPDAQTAATLATLMFSMAMIFNGVFQPPDTIPDFWMFMYYVSPFTYIIGGIAATGLHGELITCSKNELSIMEPPPNQMCGEYLREYLTQHGGEVYNPSATLSCQFCPLSSADQFLFDVKISWENRWRNFGIVWGYVVFNCLMALLLYYSFRVKNWKAGFAKGKARDMFRQMWMQILATLFGAVGKTRREENRHVTQEI